MPAWRVVACILVILALVLLALCVAASAASGGGIVGGRRGFLNGVRGRGPPTPFSVAGGAKRGPALQKAISEPPPRKLLAMEWKVFTPAAGVLYVCEAAVEKGALVETGPVGPPHSGLYSVCRAAPSRFDRDTLLSPHNLRVACYTTATRMYAWELFDSPEGRYAVRSDKILDEAAFAGLKSALERLLVGDPPHKIAPAALVKALEARGLEVHYSAAKTEPGAAPLEARFLPVWFRSEEEVARERSALMRLTQEDFDALDWSEVDAKLRPLTAQTREHSGYLAIADGAVRVLKVRPGSFGHVQSPSRAAIAFHIHPGRSLSFVEQPSTTDLRNTVGRARKGVVWELIVAPEGEYILAASDGLRALLQANPKLFDDVVHASSFCDDVAPVPCLKLTLAALRRLGFVVVFRPRAGWAERAAHAPPYYPWNETDPQRFAADFAAYGALTPAEVLDAHDWAPLLADQEATYATDPTWTAVGLHGGRVVVVSEGTSEGHTSEPSDPHWGPHTSPAVALYHVDDRGFTAEELALFRRMHAAKQLAVLLLTTPSARFAATIPAEATEVPAGLNPPPLKAMRDCGFAVEERPRKKAA